MLERVHDVKNAPRLDVYPGSTQQAAEGEQVVEKKRHVARYAREPVRESARSSSSAARPRTASRSSFAFKTTPSVCSIASASSAFLSSAASADTQSSVSDTPGTLSRSSRRSSCTTDVTWAASADDACGARSRTIASSFSNGGYSIH